MTMIRLIVKYDINIILGICMIIFVNGDICALDGRN